MSVAEVSLLPKCGSHAISGNLCTILYSNNLHLSPIHPIAPSGAVDPLLTIAPCYLLYFSDESMVME